MLSIIFFHFVLFLAGFIANILAALSGGGAGFVQLPVLLFLGLPFPMALGTHKVAVVALGLGSLASNHKLNNINWQIGRLMLFVGGICVALGSIIVVYISDFWAELILGIITCASAIYNIFKKNFGEQTHPEKYTKFELIVGSIFIGLVGLLSGSFSSGAGLFGIMVLVLWFRLSIKDAIFHSMIFVAFIWNFIGAFTIGSMGQINWEYVPMLTIGAFLGGLSGTKIIKHIKSKNIKKLFITVMFISGFMLIVKAYQLFVAEHPEFDFISQMLA